MPLEVKNEEHIEGIFDRLFRVDKSRSGEHKYFSILLNLRLI